MLESADRSGAVAILFYLDWRMTLIILIAVPVGFGILMPIGGKMYKISISMYGQLAQLSAMLTQVIGEIRLVKASNAERREEKSGYEDMDSLYRFGMKEAKINSVLIPLMSMVMVVLLVVIIGYGGVRVSSGALSAGELVSFILLLFQIMFPFSQFATFYSQLQKVMAATERLRLILEFQPESDHRAVRPAPEGHRNVEFKEVTFAYHEGETILSEVSFSIPAKKVTALVGPSGSGKTTVFSLIERFYAPSGGEICFGSEAIRDYTLESWRRKLGYVSQDSPLMTGTIRDNIVYGRRSRSPTRRLRKQRGSPTRKGLSRLCREGTARRLASGASSYPEVSANGSRLQGLCCGSRTSCCWMKRRQAWTATPSTKCRRR